MRTICSICGYIYDEAENTPWAELSEVCPVCAHPQSYFEINAENY